MITELFTACEEDNIEYIGRLLDAGVDIDCNYTIGDETPLVYSILNGCPKSVKYLLSRGASVNSEEGTITPMMASCTVHSKSESLELITLLLDCGADLKTKDDFGSDVLLYASMYNLPFVVQLLLDRGADVNTVDDMMFNCLITSVGNVRHEGFHVQKILIKNNIDILAKTVNDKDIWSYAKGSHRSELKEFISSYNTVYLKPAKR